MRRVKYNKAHLDETLWAATQTSNIEHPAYVFPTYYGFAIARIRPPLGTQYFKVIFNSIYRYDSMHKFEKEVETAW